MVACGGDDNEQNSWNDETAINYTIDEIKEILSGEWNVYGNISITYLEEKEKDFTQDYKGIITFTNEEKDFISAKLKVTEGKAYFVSGNGQTYFAENQLIPGGKCTIIKINGKTYNLQTTLGSRFEIISISKSSFKMVLENDITSDGKVIGHTHMTVYSTTEPVPSQNTDPYPSGNDTKYRYSLEGTWKGNMYMNTNYNGYTYYATVTEITFLRDPYRYSSGDGYWMDDYSRAPWDYLAFHIRWTVNNGRIKIYIIEEDTELEIYNYTRIDKRFIGHIATNGNDVEFSLNYVSSPNWSNYIWGYDAWF